jgi:hypothetical protein
MCGRSSLAASWSRGGSNCRNCSRGLQMAIAQMDNALRGRSLDFQQGQWNDQFGRQLGRDREDDFRYRADLGF